MKQETALIPENSLKVLVIDDDLGFLESIAGVLSASQMKVVATPDTLGLDHLLKVNNFDCALIDYNLGTVLGSEVIAEIRSLGYEFPCIIVTAFGDVSSAVTCMKKGAVDFIEKPCEPEEIISAIVRNSGDPVRNAELKAIVKKAKQQLLELSFRERQIVDAIVTGHTSKEIAREFGLSQRTVETHRANILSKLGLPNTASLVRLAVMSSLQVRPTQAGS